MNKEITQQHPFALKSATSGFFTMIDNRVPGITPFATEAASVAFGISAQVGLTTLKDRETRDDNPETIAAGPMHAIPTTYKSEKKLTLYHPKTQQELYTFSQGDQFLDIHVTAEHIRNYLMEHNLEQGYSPDTSRGTIFNRMMLTRILRESFKDLSGTLDHHKNPDFADLPLYGTSALVRLLQHYDPELPVWSITALPRTTQWMFEQFARVNGVPAKAHVIASVIILPDARRRIVQNIQSR